MLPFTPSHRYLGILLDETQSDENDILRVRKSMYAQGNKLISHFNKCLLFIMQRSNCLKLTLIVFME